MKILPAILAAILLLPVSSYAEMTPVTARSAITSVTVYPDRAMVTRTANVALGKGDSRVVFPDLPGEAMEDSVRVSGQGAAGTRLGTVETKRMYLEAVTNEAAKGLLAQLQALKDDDRRLTDELVLMNAQRDFYKAIQFHDAEVWSKEITQGRPAAEDWAKLVSFLVDGQGKAAERLRGIDVERRGLKDRMDALQKQINEISAQGAREQLTASIAVSASSPGDLELELSYVVMGASWMPAYEARADVDKGTVELTYQGEVAQSTSEDWKSVELAMSTARPAVGASPPVMYPWYIRTLEPRVFREEQQMMNKRAYMGEMDMMADKAMVGSVMASAPMPAPAEVMTSQAVTSGTTVQFKAVTRQDVPPDGSSHKVTIAVDTFKSEFEYYTVPKLMPNAYLKGVLSNDREYPLLPGQAAVFLGGDYLGKSVLPMTAPDEKLELALGIDDGIKVKRELVKRHEEDAGFLSKTRRINYIYRITVESYKKAARKITVQDQLPVSQQQEVVVKAVKLEPEPTTKDENGFLGWAFEISPKEKKTITIEYYVEFPRDREVGGI
ncbi:MAG: mucoidy inhibitor MuiA family protein [Nitrospirae bacterium]|nr:mucoidy inhibitor MuiA family protein [Nitrospirota bacterium]